MKSLLVLAALMAPTTPGLMHDEQGHYSLAPQPLTKVAVMCFSKGEQTSGMNKICYYDCLGDMVAINVKSHQLCPLTINR